MNRKSTHLLITGMLAAALVGCNDSDNSGDSAEVSKTASPAVLLGSCDDLTVNLAGLGSTEITGSTQVAEGELTVGGQPIPSHCLVTGKMLERVSDVDTKTYAIGFEMRLPIDWNGRFFHQGNGGIDGSVQTAIGELGGGAITNALHQGFAVLSSDAGHNGRSPLFGLDPAARVDYGYTAAQSLTPMAKELVSIAYGKQPDLSYFGGCSNGGRHTFNAFSRMPDQYDGYLAGAPGYRLPYAAVANIYGAQQYAIVASDSSDLSTAFTEDERLLVANSVLSVCDALDGAQDGMILDVEACQVAFSIENDVPSCTSARDGSCLSVEQKTVIGSIFKGAVTSDGSEFYSPFPYDQGITTSSFAGWEFNVPGTRDAGAVGFIWSVPPADPATFDGIDFSLNASIDDMITAINATDDTYTESSTSFMIPPNPEDLTAVKDSGAKIMVYHGVSDPIFSALDTTNWYKNLTANHNGDASDFARLYLVPGMGHCRGGPATDQFDLLTPLIEWVEKGTEPQNLVASARGADNVGGENTDLPANWSAGRTRPLCEYPKVARYNDSGDIEAASSFSCKL